MILIKTRGRSGRGEECQWEWHFAEGAWASGILFRARAAAQRSAARWFHLRSHTTATGRACSGDRATSSWAAAAATQSVTLEHHARTAATHLQQQHSNNTRSAGEERSRGEGAFHVGSCRRRWWWRRRRWWSDQLSASVFVPQVRAQHRAFAFFAVRPKLSVHTLSITAHYSHLWLVEALTIIQTTDSNLSSAVLEAAAILLPLLCRWCCYASALDSSESTPSGAKGTLRELMSIFLNRA